MHQILRGSAFAAKRIVPSIRANAILSKPQFRHFAENPHIHKYDIPKQGSRAWGVFIALALVVSFPYLWKKAIEIFKIEGLDPELFTREVEKYTNILKEKYPELLNSKKADQPADTEKVSIVLTEVRDEALISELEDLIERQKKELEDLRTIVISQQSSIKHQTDENQKNLADFQQKSAQYLEEINRLKAVEKVEIVKEVIRDSDDSIRIAEENTKLKQTLENTTAEYEAQKSELNEKYQNLLKEFAHEHSERSDALILLKKLQEEQLESRLKRKEKKRSALQKIEDYKRQEEKAIEARRADLEQEFVTELKKFQDKIIETATNNINEERERLATEYSQSWMDELRKFQNEQLKFFEQKDKEAQEVLQKAKELETILRQKSYVEDIQSKELQILGALFSLHFEGHKHGVKETERVKHALKVVKSLATDDPLYDSILKALPVDIFKNSSVKSIPTRVELKERWEKKVLPIAEVQAFVPHAYEFTDQIKAGVAQLLPESLIEKLDDNVPQVFHDGVAIRKIIQKAHDELINQDDIIKCTRTLQQVSGPAREAIEDWLAAANQRATWEMFLSIVESECLSLTARIPAKLQYH